MVVQLHNHSHYSILDGRSRISELVTRAKELGQPAVALTDHGVMYGAIEFYRACIASKIKPIIGVEAYMARGSMHRKDAQLDGAGSSYHLTLLAMNDIGYKNLLKLTSKAHVEGFYYRPRLDLDCLSNYSEGIFVLSGCMGGNLSSLVLDSDWEKAEGLARTYRNIFGERYAIEVNWHGHPKQADLNKGLLGIADRLGIRAVATCDSHYARPEDARSHDAMLAIQTGARLKDESRFKVSPYGMYYLHSEEEMRRAYPGRDDVLLNSEWIAEQCNLAIDFSKVMLPDFPVPEGHTASSFLKKQVYDGLLWRYGSISDVHKKRADYELDIIDKTGYSLYFLIVQDYVQYARKRQVMAVPRGSVAGSLCIYALGICDIDPVKYDIMFERFLHAERKGMPDIDMDFADDCRDDIIRYVTDRYGPSRVAHVGTFQTMGARAAVKDVARIMDLDFASMNALTKLFPEKPDATIADAEALPQVQEILSSRKELAEVVSLAKEIEGLTRGFGTHAAGMLITRTDLDDVVPVQLPPEKGAKKSFSAFVTQYDNNNSTGIIESLGLFKFDFLGLANLSIIRDTCNLIKKTSSIDLYGESGEKLYSDLPLTYDDPKARKAYDLLASGETEAVFQVESAGMRRVLRLVRPSRISDLPAIVALYRPGPMEYIPAYAEAKHGYKSIEYLHEDLRPILEETYGVVTYQDQVLLIARKIAGFTWAEVDILRKGMGKKQFDVIDNLKNKFVSQGVKQGYLQDTVLAIWEQIAPFAGYGFNRAHAYCYGYLAFVTAYLKANYPLEYMVTVLTHESGNKEKISQSVQECRRMGIDVISPSINSSQDKFSIVQNNDKKSIVFGLSAIDGMGSGACRSILEARKTSKFKSFSNFLSRIDLSVINQRSLTGLIAAGSFDEFGHRAQIQAAAKTGIEDAREESRLRALGQISLFSDEINSLFEAALPEVPAWDRKQTLQKEFAALGVYVSEHPLDTVKDQLDWYCTRTSSTVQNSAEGEIIIGGLITRVKTHPQKNGQLMAFVTVEDVYGPMDVLFFARSYEHLSRYLTEDNLVLIRAEARMRDGEISIIGNDVLILKENAPFPGTEIPPADFDWRLSSQKISSRILSSWFLYNAINPNQFQSYRLRLLSEKGDIDIDCNIPENIIKTIITT